MCLLALMAAGPGVRRGVDVYGQPRVGRGADGARPRLRHQPLDGLQGARGRSRLDDAKEPRVEVLEKTNEQSKVFIIDSSDPAQPIAQTPGAARKKLAGLSLHAVNRPLNASMGAAYAAVAGVDLPRREVYVLTDLAASQWQTGQEVEGLAEATKAIKAGKIDTFVLRVSAKEVQDVAIVSAGHRRALWRPRTTRSSFKVKLPQRRPEDEQDRRVPTRRRPGPARQEARRHPFAGGEIEVPPQVTPKLKAGLHRIEVRLQGEPDPLEFDNRRFLTLEVQPAMKILVVGQVPEDYLFVADVLDPPVRSEGLPARSRSSRSWRRGSAPSRPSRSGSIRRSSC